MAYQHQGRNTADTELGAQHLFLFRVDLDQTYGGFQTLRGLLEGRRHHAAGAAPGRPEIDQQGDVAFFYMPCETPAIQGQGLAVKQIPMTLSTTRRFSETCSRHPIDADTMCNDSVIARFPKFNLPSQWDLVNAISRHLFLLS